MTVTPQERPVQVPTGLLCEAIGFLDSLDTLAANAPDALDFAGGPEQRLADVVTELMSAVGIYADLEHLSDDEYDAAYAAHPLVEAIEAHRAHVEGQLMRTFLTHPGGNEAETTLTVLEAILATMRLQTEAIVSLVDKKEAVTGPA